MISLTGGLALYISIYVFLLVKYPDMNSWSMVAIASGLQLLTMILEILLKEYLERSS